MNWSDTRGAIAKALAAAQAEMGHASKSSINPHFRSRYADLASVIDASREALAKHGLCVTQHPHVAPHEVGYRVVVTTEVSHESGEWCLSEVACSIADAKAQSVGAAITYLRRYGYAALVGVAQDDDDGNAASGRVQAAPQADTRLEAAVKMLVSKYPELAQQAGAIVATDTPTDAKLAALRAIYKEQESK
jgi:hypothetical protein